MIFSTKPNRGEMLWGGIYLAFNLLVLPSLLSLLQFLLDDPFRPGQLNFLYFGINFAATTVIFWKFLLQSAKDALQAAFPTVQYALVGYVAFYFLGNLITSLFLSVYPGFSNVNDSSIAMMLDEDFALMAVGTIVLVPTAEELLYRGLIFRGLYDRSPVLAHTVSIVAFAFIHVAGYIGSYDAMLLLLCFLQYIPAGYCLNYAYRRSGNILSPIFMHMLINFSSVFAMR